MHGLRLDTRWFIVSGLIAGTFLPIMSGGLQRAAFAQNLLEQRGMLAPTEPGSFDPTANTYTFEGESGQTLIIELKSDDFDPFLTLSDAESPLLSNDNRGDLDINPNASIVITLRETGTYSVRASSLSNDGGYYQLEVRPASEYEQAFDRAYKMFYTSGERAATVEAYTTAIAMNDSDPSTYLGRARARSDRRFGLSQDVLDANVADWLRAADLLEQQGRPEDAAQTRELAQSVIMSHASCTDFSEQFALTDLANEIARLEVEQVVMGTIFAKFDPMLMTLEDRQSELTACFARLQTEQDEDLTASATISAIESKISELEEEDAKAQFIYHEQHPERQHLQSALEALRESLTALL